MQLAHCFLVILFPFMIFCLKYLGFIEESLLPVYHILDFTFMVRIFVMCLLLPHSGILTFQLIILDTHHWSKINIDPWLDIGNWDTNYLWVNAFYIFILNFTYLRYTQLRINLSFIWVNMVFEFYFMIQVCCSTCKFSSHASYFQITCLDICAPQRKMWPYGA